MHITQVIDRLEAILKEHGDVPLLVFDEARARQNIAPDVPVESIEYDDEQNDAFIRLLKD